jgi:tRNA(Leu) C34 or U34 (ribose-2'-O)-methylase TrmL
MEPDEKAVLLVSPKYPHNVANVLRGCSVFGATELHWTGDRVDPPSKWPPGARLPREERMKLYRDVHLSHAEDARELVRSYVRRGFTPVAVELRDNAEELPFFIHPDKALYVFGPEDGNVPRGVLAECHRFVRIPTASCLNLAVAAGAVLYDRQAKDTIASAVGEAAMKSLGLAP